MCVYLSMPISICMYVCMYVFMYVCISTSMSYIYTRYALVMHRERKREREKERERCVSVQMLEPDANIPSSPRPDRSALSTFEGIGHATRSRQGHAIRAIGGSPQLSEPLEIPTRTMELGFF